MLYNIAKIRYDKNEVLSSAEINHEEKQKGFEKITDFRKNLFEYID